MTTRRLRALVGAALVCTALAFSAGCGDDSDSPSESVFLADRFLNIAHRGGARLAPEHTLVAFENALRVGADVIEFDLHATVDGVIVILHDATVDRTTDGTGVVRNMTFAELRALDAGYRFTRDGGATFPWRGKGLTIPTLEEALERFADVPITVEFKQVSSTRPSPCSSRTARSTTPRSRRSIRGRCVACARSRR
jgi:glycerophosphoryl diester phosphodiesterase